jgi:Scaffold protein Nfu/NifU N terminal.
LKFLPGKKVSEVGPIEFLKNDKSIKVSLANKILSLEGTVMVFFRRKFYYRKEGKRFELGRYETRHNFRN